MAITFHPRVGQILICDFSTGFEPPEMIKSGRPVLVVCAGLKGRGALVTVTPLSSTAPDPPMPYHYLLPKKSMPQLDRFQSNDTWVKADMVYTVGFNRLDLIRLGKKGPNSKRLYFKQLVGRDQMQQIRICILEGLGMGFLREHC